MPGFPQFTAPVAPRQEPPNDLAKLIRRARRAYTRAGQLYTGEVYRIIAEEISYWIEAGYRFDKGRGPALFDQILTAPLPERDPGA